MIFDFKTAGVILALTAPFVLLTIWAVTSAARREFKSLGQKALWMLTASIPFVGFALYLIFGMRRGKKPGAQTD